jgi:class 3 adenylate cyclase
VVGTDVSFCTSCGEALEPVPSLPTDERKVVSVLFADLVGFTTRAERLDPEEVRKLLDTYHSTVRHELERFGGTMEKFIGTLRSGSSAPRSHTRTTRSGPCGQRWPSAMQPASLERRSESASRQAKRS